MIARDVLVGRVISDLVFAYRFSCTRYKGREAQLAVGLLSMTCPDNMGELSCEQGSLLLVLH